MDPQRSNEAAAAIHPREPSGQRAQWFQERYDLAARQIVEFLAGSFVDLAGRQVADLGCGDGIIDLGLMDISRPARLVGFDVRPTSRTQLEQVAAENGRGEELPGNLEFATCAPQRLPAGDAAFDVVVSWSAFNHMENPQSMIHEARRVLRPGGVLMLHVYPLFHSQHGSLLEPWFPEGFVHLLHDHQVLAHAVRQDPGPDPAWADTMLEAGRQLNRMTADDLARMLQIGGFAVKRCHLIAEDTSIPGPLSHLPLSHLGIGGLKLLAQVT